MNHLSDLPHAFTLRICLHLYAALRLADSSAHDTLGAEAALSQVEGGGLAMTAYIPAVFNGQIDELLDEAMRGLSRGAAWTPASNVWEDETGFHVQLALPVING